jgi:hypothetical protein
LWHIEFALRHCIFAFIRASLGPRWTEALKRVTLGRGTQKTNLCEEANRLRKNANLPNVSNLIWYLTTQQLVDVLVNGENWNEAFKDFFQGADLKTVKESLGPPGNSRNYWAHFRAEPPDKARKDLTQIVDFLKKPIARWTARYWNRGDNCNGRKMLLKTAFEKKYDDAIPLLLSPTPGYHGGFLEPDSLRDRGWHLFLELNENEDVFWVTPTSVGFSDELGINEAIRYGLAVQESAIHVALLFYENYATSDIGSEGFFDLRISLPAKDDEGPILKALKQLSDLTKSRRFTARRANSASTDEAQTILTKEQVVERLFYEAPTNIIIAPTQEWTMHFQVKVN